MTILLGRALRAYICARFAIYIQQYIYLQLTVIVSHRTGTALPPPSGGVCEQSPAAKDAARVDPTNDRAKAVDDLRAARRDVKRARVPLSGVRGAAASAERVPNEVQHRQLTGP